MADTPTGSDDARGEPHPWNAAPRNPASNPRAPCAETAASDSDDSSASSVARTSSSAWKHGEGARYSTPGGARRRRQSQNERRESRGARAANHGARRPSDPRAARRIRLDERRASSVSTNTGTTSVRLWDVQLVSPTRCFVATAPRLGSIFATQTGVRLDDIRVRPRVRVEPLVRRVSQPQVRSKIRLRHT